ncbi:MAG: thioredoxin, partial [Comamonadaceae bacterium]
LGATAPTIAPRGDWSGSVAIAVSGASAPRVAGYRLLAFYP